MGVIGTDNKFVSATVKNRWKFITSEFKKNGIEVVNFSSDGDPRYLNTMRQLMSFGKMSLVFNVLCTIDLGVDGTTWQDAGHKINNMKAKFMDYASDLKMGNFMITVNHLQILIQKIPKDQHLLNDSDLNNQDRMNFSLVEKIATENIENLLQKNVNESQGTILYLRLLRFILESFTHENIPALDRLSKSFYVLFVLRLWKYWCFKSSNANMKNFITNESFVSMEINTWILLKLLILCRDKYGAEAFKVYLMNSQRCEEFFRTLR